MWALDIFRVIGRALMKSGLGAEQSIHNDTVPVSPIEITECENNFQVQGSMTRVIEHSGNVICVSDVIMVVSRSALQPQCRVSQ